MVDKQVRVTLESSLTEVPAQDETQEYRAAIHDAGLRLIDPRTRVETLQDLFRLLKDNPDAYSFTNYVKEIFFHVLYFF